MQDLLVPHFGKAQFRRLDRTYKNINYNERTNERRI